MFLECSKFRFVSGLNLDGGSPAGGKCHKNDGGGIMGSVNECWREAKDGTRFSCVIVASTGIGGIYRRGGHKLHRIG